jgi:hypothetical protein
MLLGLDLATFTLLHVLISLVGIVAGFVVMAELLTSRQSGSWIVTFLAATIFTSLSGFLFPFTKLLPSHVVGIISLVLLAVAVFSLYYQQLRGLWRPVYVVTAMLSLYLNVFVMVIQGFLKIEPLKHLAPTQTEPPFLIVQGATLVFFVAVIIASVVKFRPIARSYS